MNFVKKSLKYPQVTLSILALTFLVGVYSLMEMPRREDAKVKVRVGQVIALYPGANALQVEEQVPGNWNSIYSSTRRCARKKRPP